MDGGRDALKNIWTHWSRQILVILAIGLGVFVWLFPTASTNAGETRKEVVAIAAGVFAIYLGARTASRLWPERWIYASDRWLGKFLGKPKRYEPPAQTVPTEQLRRSTLTTLPLMNVDLRDATLPGADLAAANLTGATLRGADLTGAALRNADLRDADLSRSDLRFAGLGQASLAGANLRDARLDGANLTGADLRTADLQGASLRGVLYDGSTLWPTRVEPTTIPGAENVDEVRP